MDVLDAKGYRHNNHMFHKQEIVRFGRIRMEGDPGKQQKEERRQWR
jgi:hypothetical protein